MLWEPCQKWKNSHDEKWETKELSPQDLICGPVQYVSQMTQAHKASEGENKPPNKQKHKDTVEDKSTATNYSVMVRNSLKPKDAYILYNLY